MGDSIPFENKPPVSLRPTKRDACKHPTYEVDDHLPDVSCGVCGAALDPYWCLRQQAHHYQNMTYRLRALEELDAKYKAKDERRRKLREARRK